MRGDSTGGSLELAGLIDKYGEFILPDLRRYYGIDLLDLFREERPLSPRYVLAHIRNLDYQSAFVAEVRGGQQYRGWDEDRYMDAAQINALRTLIYIFILANTDPKKRKPNRLRCGRFLTRSGCRTGRGRLRLLPALILRLSERERRR